MAECGSLRLQQRKFCVEYVKDFNGTQAAIRAGYSDNNADAIASRLLRNVKVSAFVQELTDAAEAAAGITHERILREYARLAFSDPRQLYDESGRLKEIKDLDADTAASIAGMDIEHKYPGGVEYVVKKYKFIDRTKALDSLAKIVRLLVDRRELTGEDGKPIQHQHAFKDLTVEQAKKIAQEFLVGGNGAD